MGWRTFGGGQGELRIQDQFLCYGGWVEKGPLEMGHRGGRGSHGTWGCFVDINPHGTLAGAMLSTSRDTQLLALIRLLELIKYSPKDTPTQKRVL